MTCQCNYWRIDHLGQYYLQKPTDWRFKVRRQDMVLWDALLGQVRWFRAGWGGSRTLRPGVRVIMSKLGAEARQNVAQGDGGLLFLAGRNWLVRDGRFSLRKASAAVAAISRPVPHSSDGGRHSWRDWPT
jgi:hypothetical protein